MVIEVRPHIAWQHYCSTRSRFPGRLFTVVNHLTCSLQAGLVPGSSVGMGNNGTGCFAPGAGVNNGKPWSFFTASSAFL